MQPIKRTTVLEEVNGSDIPMHPLHYPVTRPAEEQLAPVVEVSTDGQIYAAEGAADAGQGSPRASEQYIGQIDPKAPGWKRRVRIGAAVPGRTPCPNQTTALEKAIHGFADNPGDNVIVPTLGTSFGSLGEAYDFYNLYLREKGFGIRYGKSRLNVERTKCMQEIVCGCALREYGFGTC